MTSFRKYFFLPEFDFCKHKNPNAPFFGLEEVLKKMSKSIKNIVPEAKIITN
jgi:hypothetical protein